MRWTNLILRLFDRLECARREERKDGGTEAHDCFTRNQHRSSQNVRINLVQDVVLLRNAARINNASDVHAMSGHAVEDHARVERSAFNGGKQLVLSRALEIPAPRDATQVGIYQNRAVAIVPGHAEQTGLPRVVILQPPAERAHIGSGAGGNGVKNVAHGGKARLDSGTLRMHTSLNNPAYAKNQVDRGRDPNNACGRTNYVYHVIRAATSADGIPVSIESSNRDRNARLKPKPLCPAGRKCSCNLVRGRILAI